MDFFIALLALLFGFLAIAAFIAGVVTLIILLVKTSKNKPARKTSITAGSLIGGSIVSFILMIFMTMSLPGDEPSTPTTASTTTSNAETQSGEDDNEQSQSATESFAESRESTELTDEEKAEREESAAEYQEQQEAEKSESEEVIEEEEPAEEKDLATEEIEEEQIDFEDVGFNHEVIEGIDVFTDFTEMMISPNNYMSNFSIEMSDLLNDIHGDLDNGVIFRNAATTTDGYGNDEEKIMVNVWYTQETIERIDYDNWPQLVGEDLYNSADAVTIHTMLDNDVDVENKQLTDEVPRVFVDSIGAPYEED